MSKIMEANLTSRRLANGFTEGVVIHAEGKFLKRPSRPLDDGNVSRTSGLGFGKADHVVADVVWFQAKKLAAAHSRKGRNVSCFPIGSVLDIPKQRG